MSKLGRRWQEKPRIQVVSDGETAPPESITLARLNIDKDLSTFDLDAIAIALAPELDRRYELLYAYLQDDERCLQPSVDLTLKILCPTAEAKLSQRDRFSPNAPLIRHQLLHLVSDPNQPKPSLLAHNLQLDEQVVRFLLGEKGLDSRLASFCQLVQPAVSLLDLRLKESFKQAMRAIALSKRQTQQPLRLYFQGSDRPLARRTAEALATELQTPLLTADLARIIAFKADFEPTLNLILRGAWFENALLYLDSIDTLQGEEHVISYQYLLSAIAKRDASASFAQTKGITILAGSQPWKPGTESVLGIVTVPFSVPDFALRRLEWQERLSAAGISISETDLDALGDRLRAAQLKLRLY